jgi:hypothetical protein
MVTSYNMVLLLREELSLAIYRPKYKSSSLEVENYRGVKVFIGQGNNNVVGNITNLDKDGFVIKLDQNTQLKGLVDINIPFEGNEFYAQGLVSTKFHHGYGIKLITSKKSPSVLGWNDLYNIFYMRGYNI